METSRTVFLVNPNSQNGALGKQWPRVAEVLRKHLGAFESVHTSRAGEATELTRNALRGGASRVVAVGGDGTINEVVNGFFDNGVLVSEEACMGIVPFGTGGDFRKTAQIPKDIELAAQILAKGQTQTIDLGHIKFTHRDRIGQGERLFINIASFGLSGEVDEEVNQSSKFLGGTLTFMLATTKVGLRYKPKRVRIVVDGDKERAIEKTIGTVAIANGKYFGGGMKFAPNAEIDDEAFDIIVMEQMGLVDSVRNTRRLYSGAHLALETVTESRGLSVFAESLDGQEVLLDVDGEVPGILPATFTVLPNALRLILP